MPALATATSRRPKRSMPWATAASICSRLQTSPSTPVALSGPSSASSSRSGWASRSTSTTLAPRRTSPRAVAAPTPRAPPVMSTTCPLSLPMAASPRACAGVHGRPAARGGRHEVDDRLGDQPGVVPHRRVPDPGGDAELDAGDLLAQPRRVALHGQDAVLAAPQHERGHSDLVEVVHAGVAGAQHRVDVLDDVAAHR